MCVLERDIETSLFCIGELYQSYGYETAFASLFTRYIIFYYPSHPFMLELFNRKEDTPDLGEIMKQLIKCKPTMMLPNLFSAISRMDIIIGDKSLNKLKAFKKTSPREFTKDIYLLYHHPNGLETVQTILAKSYRVKRYISIKNQISVPDKIERILDYYFYGGEIYLYIHKYKKPRKSPELEPLEDQEMVAYKHKATCPKRRRRISLCEVCFHPQIWINAKTKNDAYKILGQFWKDGTAGLSQYWKNIYERKGEEAFEEWVVDKYGDHDETWPIAEKEKSHNIIQFERNIQEEILRLLKSKGLVVDDLIANNGKILSGVSINEIH
jgi:hypothetical protein